MGTLKKFRNYILAIVAFFVLTEVLVNLGFRASYRDLTGTNQVEQVTVNLAEATNINGRVQLSVRRDIELKNFVKVEFFSERNVSLGSYYIDVAGVKLNTTANFEFSFKQRYVKYYLISQVDEKPEQGKLFDLTLDKLFVDSVEIDLEKFR